MFRHRTRARRDESGVVAVEAAIVTPLLLLMVFGIIELSLLLKDDVALTSAVRTGGRIASANAGAGVGGTATTDGSCLSPCSPANAPMLAQLAANAIQRAGTALPKDSITDLWIYKANNRGFPGAANATSWVCTSDCVRFKWVSASDEFRYYSGTWTSSTINACANNTDAVGVYLKADHQFTTGIFNNQSATIEDHAVFSFEPLPTLTCSSGTHS